MTEKRALQIIALCVSILVSTACNRSFTFIHLSDPQIGFLDDSPGYEHSDSLMKAAFYQALSCKPDFVVNTGDLVNNPGDAVQDSIYKANLSILGKLPYWALPGNHDIMGYSQEKRDDYLAKRGYDRFSFVHKGWAFIGIDSNCIKDYTESDEAEQFGWLEAQLRASEGRKGIVVFFHHPVIRKDMDEPEEYFNLPVPQRERYIGLFKKYGVKAVLTGHAHIPSMTVCDGIAFCTAGAVGSPLGGSRSGYAVVKISGRKLSWTFVPTEILLN